MYRDCDLATKPRLLAPIAGRLCAIRRALGLLLTVMLLASCGTPSVDSRPPRRQVTSDGLEMVRSTNRSKLWVRPDHHLGRYDDILVTEIAFAYARGQESLEPGQEEEIGEMLKAVIGGMTEGTPVGQARRPGECVVAMRLGLKDMRFHIGRSTGSSVSHVSSFGEATMIVEFRDSLTDLALVRYAAHQGLGGGPGTGQLGANLGRLGAALGRMVQGMIAELQDIVPDTTERPETSCNEGIYKMTGRGQEPPIRD